MKNNTKNKKKTKKAFGYIFEEIPEKFTPIGSTWEELAKQYKNPKGKYFQKHHLKKTLTIKRIDNGTFAARLIGFQYPNGDNTKPPLFVFLIINEKKKAVKIWQLDSFISYPFFYYIN